MVSWQPPLSKDGRPVGLANNRRLAAQNSLAFKNYDDLDM